MNYPGFDFVQSEGGISEYRLRANGLRVLVYPIGEAPVATFMITYHVGSRNEGGGLTGATHFLEHMMFKGTERFTKDKGTSVFQMLQSVGAQVNATTWTDRTNYYALLPAKHLPLAVEIEADRMRNLALREEDVASERSVILNELDRGLNQPFRRLYQAVWSSAYQAHPYHHPTIGWRADVETMPTSGLRGFYDTFYWPDNATATVIGAVDTEDALALVRQHFEAIGPAPAKPPSDVTREPNQNGERKTVVRMSGGLGAVMTAFKSPAGLEDDTDALAMLSTILASGKTGRLYRRLVDTSRATQCSAGVTRFRDPGLFYFMAFLADGVTHQEIEDEFRALAKEIADDGVSEEELVRARSKYEASEAYARDGSYGIAARLNEALAVGDWRLFTQGRSRMDRIVSADVQRAAAACLVDRSSTTGWFVPDQ